MAVIYTLLLALSARPLYNYGREAYLGLKTHDYPKLKANLLFFSITIIVVVGLTVLIVKF
jgi:hypothetical protein